ncbi:TolC family protein [Cysteiniphilum sp. QT6929]|uniref:TolC family protein n=1 Tax=Cysteiniphilum sp. QT6929 TaxID=2975055 RepID=UPI0024B3923F|nr:TolC family protein [Cysteiniphilum sp. QT6929]WHN64746.1 TolC family protein [Cysteiniphilum sp. QT6929]
MLSTTASFGFCKSFSLQQAVQYAIEHAPSLKSQQSQLNIGTLQKDNAFAAFLPKLDLVSTSTASDTTYNAVNSTGFNTGNTFGLQLSEDFSQNGIKITNYYQVKIQTAIDQLNYRYAKDQLIQKVANNFVQYSLNVHNLKLQETLYQQYQTQYLSANTLYKQGLKSRSDELNLKTQLLSTEIALKQQKQSLKVAKQELLKSMGVSAFSPQDFSFNVLALQDLKDIPKALTHFSEQYLYQYKLWQLQQQKDDWSINQAKRNYWPNASFSINGGYQNPYAQNGFFGGIGARKEFGWNATLTLSFNLFDGGTLDRNIVIAEETKLKNQYDNQGNILDVQKTLADLLNDFKNQYDTLPTAIELQKYAKESYTSVKRNFQAGSQSYLDLINALSSLQTAEQTMLNLYASLLKDTYQYHFYKGDIERYVFKNH